MDMVYNNIMARMRACIECNKISIIHSHDLCSKCYYKQHNQKPEVKKRKAKWAKESGYSKRRYRENIDYYRVRNKIHAEKNKDKKREYDKKHRDDLRFGGNREKVLKRDNHQCQECGSKENLVIHHIDGKSVRKNSTEINNELSNLIILCNSCHMKKHGGKDRNPCKKFWDFVSKAVRMDISELEELAEKMKDSID